MVEEIPDDDLVWVDAPPRRWAPRVKPIITAEQEKKLRANPGRWAKTKTYPGPSSAHQARKRWKDGPGHLLLTEWEVEARKFGDGTSAVFMRYVGGTLVDEMLDQVEHLLEVTRPSDVEVVEEVPDLESDGESTSSSGDVDDSVDSSVATSQEPPPEHDEEESDEETEAAYQDQVGIINGVCGPCRRLRCFLCATPGCACKRPNHLDKVRSA